MVSKPANQAERTFFKVAWGGGVGVAILTIIVIFGWWGGAKSTKPVEPFPKISVPGAPEAATIVSPPSAACSGATDGAKPISVLGGPAHHRGQCRQLSPHR